MADKKKSWMDSISETVDKATKAASEAWEGTADARKDAWDKTKAAANSASEAIDQGVDRARDSFKSDAAPPSDRTGGEESQEPEETVVEVESDDLEVWDVIDDSEDSDESDSV